MSFPLCGFYYRQFGQLVSVGQNGLEQQMVPRISRLARPAIVGVVIALVGLASSLANARPADESEPTAAVIREAQGELLNQGQLESAASITGFVRQEIRPSDWNIHDAGALVASATDIVVGRVTRVSAALSGESSSVVAVVSLAVEDSVKGRFTAGDTATVIVYGGKFRFPNGSWAETLLRGIPPPIVGQRIYAFLKPNQLSLGPRVLEAADPFPVLTPIHSSVGLLEVNEAGNVVVRQWVRHQTFVISGTSESDLREQLVAAEKNRADGSR